jgi:uncharacterized protein DUF6328
MSDEGSRPGEDHKARIDRELIELLNELRVALPGVQVLFAFLLILPFQAGFSKVDALATDVFFAGMVSAAISIVVLIAPATYHRLNMRRGTDEKEEMLFTSSKLALLGTAFLGISIGCSLFVVTDVLFGSAAALAVAVVIVALTAGLWYVMPLWRRRPGTGERRKGPDG